ncbi:MAG: hypothetical protein GKS00_08950 [Alphaproteobacteria bacterium]|nr:hypothetical protein [Alphaproteobacteria bacterium]
MKREIISAVEITETGQLMLILASGGESFYEHIYREAAGVYWSNEKKGFHSAAAPKEWSYSDWFKHIVEAAESLDVALELGANVAWKNVPDHDERVIKKLEETQ